MEKLAWPFGEEAGVCGGGGGTTKKNTNLQVVVPHVPLGMNNSDTHIEIKVVFTIRIHQDTGISPS